VFDPSNSPKSGKTGNLRVSYSTEGVEILYNPFLETAEYCPYFRRNHYQRRFGIHFLLCEDIEVDNDKGKIPQGIVIDGPVEEAGYQMLIPYANGENE